MLINPFKPFVPGTFIEDREKQLNQEARGQQGPNITQRKLH